MPTTQCHRGVAATMGLLLLFLCLLNVVTVGSARRSGSKSDIRCPTQCRCSRLRHSDGVVTECPGEGLTSIPVTYMDPGTVRLDLTHNGIRQIRTDTFMILPKLEVLLLSDNHIHNLEANAFSGLRNIKSLDLKRNRLQILKANSLARISGHPSDCASDECVLDLRENNLKVIETNALSWIKGLSVLIGGGAVPLTLKPYAFYGLQDIPTIEMADVPSLTLERHAITNAERVGSVKIMNTRLSDVQNFTFQGLEDVGSIVLHKAEVTRVAALGFGGVRYDRDASTVTTSVVTRNATVLRGGVFNMSYCQVAQLDGDIFLDTNLAHIVLTGNRIYEIAPHVFRGLRYLQTFHLIGNTIPSLPSRSLGELSALDELVLERNQIDVIENGAFRGSRDIGLFRLSLQLGSNLTLSSYAFADVLDVSEFQLVGSSPMKGTSFGKTPLTISQDAFHNFVAEKILLEDVSLPTLRLNSFRGLSKVQNLTFVSCDIESVESEAFGGTYGGVHTMEIRGDSQLPCDCDTHRLLWEFQKTFASFQVHCVTAAEPGESLQGPSSNSSVPLQEMAWTFCTKSSSVKCLSRALFIILTFISTLILL